ncbi:MAG: type II toxin-antitoxin system VapB family antitoxin [Pyrinomonadaceae bacterium]|nr:type II toxin-antitoxin system VapB family antitoxin [Pyrinomonadaceae bacterium]
MRVRTNIIISEDLLAKIDVIAGEKQRRSAVIEIALREYVAREESKAPADNGGAVEVVDEKADSRAKLTKV